MVCDNLPKKRFIELDILRGIAITAMICFHLLWDLDYYGLSNLDVTIYRFSLVVPTIFFVLIGMCLIVSTKQKDSFSLVKRGGYIFTCGMMITLLSALLIPEKIITFGVLHCIGVSIILSIPFLKIKNSLCIISSILCITIGYAINNITVEYPAIFQYIVGFHQVDLWKHTVDYFPLLPWFGILLCGMSIGNILYKDGQRQFYFPDISHLFPVKMISWLGQHSLGIYFLHHPLIVGAIVLYLYF